MLLTCYGVLYSIQMCIRDRCKAALYDLADLDKLKEEMEDSYLFTNATGVGMKPLEGQTYIPDKSFFRPDLIVIDLSLIHISGLHAESYQK